MDTIKLVTTSYRKDVKIAAVKFLNFFILITTTLQTVTVVMLIIHSMSFPRMMAQNTLRLFTVHGILYFYNLIYFRSLTFLYGSVESFGLVGIPIILSFTTFILSIGATFSSTEGSSPYRNLSRTSSSLLLNHK